MRFLILLLAVILAPTCAMAGFGNQGSPFGDKTPATLSLSTAVMQVEIDALGVSTETLNISTAALDAAKVEKAGDTMTGTLIVPQVDVTTTSYQQRTGGERAFSKIRIAAGSSNRLHTRFDFNEGVTSRAGYMVTPLGISSTSFQGRLDYAFSACDPDEFDCATSPFGLLRLDMRSSQRRLRIGTQFLNEDVNGNTCAPINFTPGFSTVFLTLDDCFVEDDLSSKFTYTADVHEFSSPSSLMLILTTTTADLLVPLFLEGNLDVRGEILSDSSITGTHFGDGSNLTGIVTAVATPLKGDGSGGDPVTLDSASNITISTLTLSVGSSGVPSLGFSDDTDTGLASFNADELTFITAAQDRWKIRPDGGLVALAEHQILAGDLNSANPSFSFRNDPDTGMFSLGSNGIGFSAGNTQGFQIEGNGNFLIGIGAGAQGKLEVRPSASNDFSLFVGSQNATAVMVIDRLGRMGIGTDSPQATLSVNGNASMGQLTLVGSSLTVNGAGKFTGDLEVENYTDVAAQFDAVALSTSTFPRLFSKTVSESVSNSTVLQDDDDLFASLDTNSTYEFKFVLVSSVAANDANLKFGLTFPAGTTILAPWTGAENNGSFVSGFFITADSGEVLVVKTADTSFVTIQGTLKTSGTSGTLQLRWAQNTATAGELTIQAGSWLKVVKQ